MKIMNKASSLDRTARPVKIATGAVTLEGDLAIPDGARGIVLFAHGSGSSRQSPRNRFVAETLVDGGLATLLFDLLTQEEEYQERLTRHLRFDIGLLARRLLDATDWAAQQPETRDLKVGYFGASTGGGAAPWRRPSGRRPSTPWSLAEAGPTWPVRRWPASVPRRC